jgi:thiamine pyrophosphokinase
MILNYLIVNNLLISLGGNCTVKSINNTETFEKIIAVDSGYENLTKHDLKPDVLIGDLDSVDEELINIAKSEGVEIFEFNKDKDESDFELAINYSISIEAGSITIIGGENGEIDHLFSIYNIISNCKFDNGITWLYENYIMNFESTAIFSLPKGEKFSIIPISNLENLNIEGSKYELHDTFLPKGSSRTIRNESIGKEITVSCSTGLFNLVYKL